MSLAEQIFGYGGGDPYEDDGDLTGLQFNPTPGRMQAVQDLVDGLNKAHKDIKSAEDAIRGIHDGACWTGAAAEGFRQKTGSLPKMLDTASRSFSSACKALRAWHSYLENLQSKASSYEKEARRARQRAERAEKDPDLGLLGDGSLSIQEVFSEEQLARRNNAVEELNTANSELESIISHANSLKSQHEELAGVTASRLAAAGEQAPDEPGLLDALGNLAKDIMSLQGDIVNWVKEHANAIAAVGDVLALVILRSAQLDWSVTCPVSQSWEARSAALPLSSLSPLWARMERRNWLVQTSQRTPSHGTAWVPSAEVWGVQRLEMAGNF